MVGIFKFVLIFAAFLAIVTLLNIGVPRVVAAESSISWSGRPVIGLSQHEVSTVPSGADTCSASILPLFVEGETGIRESCVFGGVDGLRLARYFDARGQLSYAVAYATDSRFVPVRNLCSGMMRCAYSQSEDVLVLEAAISPWESGTALVDGFASRLVRHSDGSRFYTFTQPPDLRFLGAAAAHRFSTGAVAISPNGKWALIELRGYGVARIDLRTAELKRVAISLGGFASPGGLLEMSISDDGRRVALMGRGVGMFVYEVTNGCGDMPGEVASGSVVPGGVACGYTVINPTIVPPRLQWSSVPRFSENGDRLAVYGIAGSTVRAITLSPLRTDLPVNPSYIAFGDSFTSGEGELDDSYYGDTNTLTNRCHTSSRSYPYLLGDSWEIVTKSVACSGSRTRDVASAARKILQDDPVSSPSVMTIGVGGNDIDLVGKLKSCLAPGTCEWASESKLPATAVEIRSLLPKLVDLIGEMRRGFSSSPVVVMGYPTIINPDEDAPCGVLLATLFSHEERRYMNETIAYLNKILHAAASYAGVSFVDTSDAFLGERLCEGESLAMNSIRFGDDIAPVPFLGETKLIGAESFHPTPFGHARIVSSTESSFREFWRNPYCNLCWFDETALVPSDYWGGFAALAWRGPQQLSMEFLKATSLVAGGDIALSFLPNTFSSNAPVSIELHSEPQLLKNSKANEDGSLEVTVRIPHGTAGYHTIHVLGEGVSGETVDAYQTVHITGDHVGSELQDTVSPVGVSVVQSLGLAAGRIEPRGHEREVLGRAVTSIEAINPGNQKQESKRDKASLRTNRANTTWLIIALATALVLFTTFMFKARKRKQSPSRPDN